MSTDFVENYKNLCEEYFSPTEELLEIVMDVFYAGKGAANGVMFSRIVSLDREGANHLLIGILEKDEKKYYFEIRDGNNNGTEVKHWEREY
jgi:hypothetical protein